MMMTTMMMMMMRYKLVLPQFMIFPRRRWLPLGQVRVSSEGAALHFELSPVCYRLLTQQCKTT